MRGERQLLRLGGYLVGWACQSLPPDAREERYREWVAELPAILHDPQVRLAPWRAVRMLGYAADTLRGAVMTPGRARHRTPPMDTRLSLLLLAGLMFLEAAWTVWTTARAPGDGQNYLQLAWALLLMAYAISKLAHRTARMSTLLLISAALALVAANLWAAAQAPEDWANYLFAAALLLVLGWWLVIRWARTRRA